MAEHKATIEWKHSGDDFLKGRYSREHTWAFDGGATIPASPAPSVVPPPMSNPAHVDPEEAYVASLASCHMLTFLYMAQRAGFVVAQYRDEAIGVMGKTDKGLPWVAEVLLNPVITYGGEKTPEPDAEAHLHEQAHDQCFIANSVRTAVKVSPSRG